VRNIRNHGRTVYERLDRIEGQHWWFCARRSIIAAAIGRFAPRRKVLRLLEAGCGTGGNLRLLAGFGTVNAFELDDDARRLAQGKLDVDVKYGMLPDGVPDDLACKGVAVDIRDLGHRGGGVGFLLRPISFRVAASTIRRCPQALSRHWRWFWRPARGHR
jgi:SAM-dependent methyltransferase